ncbi:MAG TPA: hypothetical protein VHO67_01455, partial [Polyangia bacterium]|nr:hypothetical protein [Polyangia bacterium]
GGAAGATAAGGSGGSGGTAPGAGGRAGATGGTPATGGGNSGCSCALAADAGAPVAETILSLLLLGCALAIARRLLPGTARSRDWRRRP